MPRLKKGQVAKRKSQYNHHELNDSAYDVMIAINNLTKNDVYPSEKRIMIELGLFNTTGVHRQIQTLKSKGYLDNGNHLSHGKRTIIQTNKGLELGKDMKALRNIETEPADYAVGDRVLLNHWWQKPVDGADTSFLMRVDEYCEGVISNVGYSLFDKAYDWYVITLDNGECVESWWMTTYKIIKKLESVEPESTE